MYIINSKETAVSCVQTCLARQSLFAVPYRMNTIPNLLYTTDCALWKAFYEDCIVLTDCHRGRKLERASPDRRSA